MDKCWWWRVACKKGDREEKSNLCGGIGACKKEEGEDEVRANVCGCKDRE